MKACFLRAPAKVESNPLVFGDVPKPEPLPGEILIRVEVCGVCRTDLHVIEGELPPRKLPIIPGHQVVGHVAATGAGAGRLAIGSRVGIAWLRKTDGTCEYCREFLRLAAEIPVKTQVQVYPLAEANRALNALKNDAIRGAAVLSINS